MGGACRSIHMARGRAPRAPGLACRAAVLPPVATFLPVYFALLVLVDFVDLVAEAFAEAAALPAAVVAGAGSIRLLMFFWLTISASRISALPVHCGLTESLKRLRIRLFAGS